VSDNEVMFGMCPKCRGPLLNGHSCPDRSREIARLVAETAKGRAKDLKPPNYGPFYAAGLYPKLAELFRKHGYALAVHGSVANDFDVIAVPWVEDAADPQTVIDEAMTAFAFKQVPDGYRGEAKPHGRLAFRVPFSFGACSMDVSFMPRIPSSQGEKS